MSESAPMFSCNACGRSFRWKPELAGKHVKCKCGASLTVPTDEPAMAPAPARTASRPAPASVSNVIANAASATPDATDGGDTAATKEKETLNLVSPGGIGVLVLFLLLIAYTTYRYVYKFTASPTKITTVEQANAMSDGDYVQIDLPLSDEARMVEAEIGGDRYAIIHFIGPDKVSLCLEDAGDTPFDQVPDPIVGRVNTQEMTDNWRVYGRALDFGFHKDTKLITLQLPPAPNDWFTILSVAGILYILAFLKDLIYGPEDEEAKDKMATGDESDGA